MKNTFARLVSRLDTAIEGNSESHGMLIESFKNKKQREKGLKKQNTVFKSCGMITKGVTYM